MRAYSQSINYITINNKRFSLLAMSIAKAHIVERLDRLSEIFPMIIALNELNKDSRVITNFNRYIKDIDKMRLKFSKSSIKPRTIGAAISTAILAITTTLSGIITALGSPQFASFTNSTINILNSFSFIWIIRIQQTHFLYCFYNRDCHIHTWPNLSFKSKSKSFSIQGGKSS
jgi:hypothetical protein